LSCVADQFGVKTGPRLYAKEAFTGTDFVSKLGGYPLVIRRTAHFQNGQKGKMPSYTLVEGILNPYYEYNLN